MAAAVQTTPLKGYVGMIVSCPRLQKVSTASPRKLSERCSSVVFSSMLSLLVSLSLLCALMKGQTGLGKSTLVNTLFASHLINSKGRFNPNEAVRSTTEIEAVSHMIEENGVRLRLNIVDTPGYGDQINNDRCWDPIIKYIKDQHSAYLRRELTATRDKFIIDSRIHCCLFFIAPTGHQLKPLDVQVLKRLSDVVNVVPVIAKSDSLTMEERAAFKLRIRQEFRAHGLRMYPYDSEDLEEDERALNETIANIMPFAIVGSEMTAVINGKQVQARQNRWGTINIEDEKHCEFV